LTLIRIFRTGPGPPASARGSADRSRAVDLSVEGFEDEAPVPVLAEALQLAVPLHAEGLRGVVATEGVVGVEDVAQLVAAAVGLDVVEAHHGEGVSLEDRGTRG